METEQLRPVMDWEEECECANSDCTFKHWRYFNKQTDEVAGTITRTAPATFLVYMGCDDEPTTSYRSLDGARVRVEAEFWDRFEASITPKLSEVERCALIAQELYKNFISPIIEEYLRRPLGVAVPIVPPPPFQIDGDSSDK